jgi:hypothetical protein
MGNAGDARDTEKSTEDVVKDAQRSNDLKPVTMGPEEGIATWRGRRQSQRRV